jgi:hypothetical protein
VSHLFEGVVGDWADRPGVYLNSRHFKGLEQRYGMDEPATLEQGRSGIARGYGEEKE